MAAMVNGMEFEEVPAEAPVQEAAPAAPAGERTLVSQIYDPETGITAYVYSDNTVEYVQGE